MRTPAERARLCRDRERRGVVRLIDGVELTAADLAALDSLGLVIAGDYAAAVMALVRIAPLWAAADELRHAAAFQGREVAREIAENRAFPISSGRRGPARRDAAPPKNSNTAPTNALRTAVAARQNDLE